MATDVLLGLTKWRKTPRSWNPLGVNAGPAYVEGGRFRGALGDLTTTFSSRYRSIGVRGVRTHDFYGPFDMSWYDPELDGAREFRLTSECLAEILDDGLEVYLRIGYSFPGKHEKPYPDKIKSSATQEAFCRSAVAFAREVSEQAGSRLKFIEIWNEPDLEKFWPWSGTDEKGKRAKQSKCKATFEAFCRLYCRVARALRNALGSSIKIGGPGFTQRADDRPRQCRCVVVGNRLRPAREFVEFVDKRKETPLDFLSWHLYLVEHSGKMSKVDTRELEKLCKTFRGYLSKTRLKKIPFHLTEWGFNEGKLRRKMHSATGVSKLTAYWIAILNQNIEQAYFYRGHANPERTKDSPGDGGSGSDKATVLIDKDGEVALAGRTFRLWSMFWRIARGPDGRLLRVTARDTEGRSCTVGLTRMNMSVPALAACNDQGTAILVTNDTDEDLDYRFKIPDRGIVSGKVCRIERISGKGNPGVFLPNRDRIRLNRCATHLVLVTWDALRSGNRTESSFGTLSTITATAKKVSRKRKASATVRTKKPTARVRVTKKATKKAQPKKATAATRTKKTARVRKAKRAK